MTISLRSIHYERFGIREYSGLLFCVLGSLASGYLVAVQRWSELTFVFGLVLVLAILRYPRLGFYLFILLLFIPIGYIKRYFFAIPNVLRWLPHFVLLLTLASYIVRYRWSNPGRFQLELPRYFKLFAVLTLVLGTVSTLYNESPFLVGALGLRTWLFFCATFVLLQFALKSYKARVRFLKLIAVAGLLQLPVLLLQRVLFYAISPDMMTGSFASYADLLFLEIFCIVLTAIWWFAGKRLLNLSPMLYLLMPVTSMVLSNAKAAWLYLPTMVLVAVRRIFLRRPGRSLSIFLILMILGFLGTYAYDLIYRSRVHGQSAIELLTNVDRIIEYNFFPTHNARRPDEDMARGEAILFNYDLIGRDPVTLLIGLGPGNLSDSQIQSGNYFESDPDARTGVNSNQIAVVLGETGILGILLLAWLFLSIYRSKQKFGEDEIFKDLRKATCIWVVLLLVYYQVMASLLVGSILAVLIAPVSEGSRIDMTEEHGD